MKKIAIGVGAGLLILAIAAIGAYSYVVMFKEIHEYLYPGCK